MNKSPKSLFTLFFIVFFFPFISIAQSEDKKFEHLTMKEGLSSNNVNCIFQDSRGFLWFGTENGIDKYDGYNFFNYNHDPRDSLTLSDNVVTDIQEDKFGNLWIATNDGLNRLDPVSGRFETFYHNQNNPNCPSDNVINTLYIDENNDIWIGIPQGLDKLSIDPEIKNRKKYIFKNFRIDTIQKYSYVNVINKIYEDHEGLLWIGTMDGLFCFDRNSETFTSYLNDPKNPNSISGNHIKSIYEDKNHNLWIGTWQVFESGSFVPNKSGLLNRYDKKTNQFKRYKRNEDPYYISYVSSIVEDPNGTLWFGAMENHGLYRYEKSTDQFQRYGHFQNNPHSISSNFITVLYIDKSGIMWIATHQGGISKYDPNKEKFKHFEHLLGVENTLHFDKVSRIIEDSFGIVWIGTIGNKIGFYDLKSGLFDKYKRYQYYGGTPVKDKKNLSFPYIMDILEDNSKNIWIGTVIGLNKYDRTTRTYKKYFEKPGDPNNPNLISSSHTICLLQDSYGFLWVGTYNGLNRMNIKEESFKHYFHNPVDSNSISSNRIDCLFEDQSGDLWFGSFDSGLNLYNRSNDRFIRYSHDPFDKYSLSDDRVTVITDDKTGNIWIGTMMGLNKFDKQTQKFTLYTTRDGLCNNYVVGILEDEQGYLWISTKNGLSKFNYAENTFRNYDESDGLQSNEFNKMSFHKGKSGRFYFGGNNGFNMFYPDSIKDNPFIPTVLITSIKISNKPVQLQQSIFEIKEIQFLYFENDISFDFVALNYTNSHKNEYAYQLDGYDNSWNYCGAQRFANFTNLDPGEYTFHVKGSNNDGIWNEEGASLKIIILPPWWQTWWFRILAGLSVLGLVAFIYNNRVSALRKKHQAQKEFSRKLIDSQEKERKRIATALHDSHGQNLLIISNELQQHIQEHQEFEKELKPVTDTVQESLNEIREIAYDLHPHPLDKLGLKDAVETNISKIENSTDIKFTLHIDDIEGLFSKKIELNLYRIIQEAVNNIIKHSQATKAHIEIKKNVRNVTISIKDNGTGFSQKEVVNQLNGLGLAGIKERVNLVNGRINIKSNKKSGTTILFKLPT